MRGSPKRLVVGLGNPGARYHATRHNVGFAVLDRLAQREGVLFESSLALAREGYVGPANAAVAWLPGGPSDSGGRALLVKPQTYMNLSGEAVGPLLDWAQLEPAELLIHLEGPHQQLQGLVLRA